ncbi:MAG: hypothetical protein GX797_02690 [Chloroflexi bacterium]|jgi:hypothetical protein|nr:hypothetical protein [Chloroflexota bacterium]
MNRNRANLIILVGSVIGLLSFFLPWVKVEAMIIGNSSASGFSFFSNQGSSILILAMVAFLLAAGLSIFTFVNGQITRFQSPIAIVLGLLALLSVIGTWVYIKDASNNEITQLVAEIKTQFGIFLAIFSALSVILGGILGLLESTANAGTVSLKNLKDNVFGVSKPSWQGSQNPGQPISRTPYRQNPGQQARQGWQPQDERYAKPPYQPDNYSQSSGIQQQQRSLQRPLDQSPQWQPSQQQDRGQIEPQDRRPQWQAEQQQVRRQAPGQARPAQPRLDQQPDRYQAQQQQQLPPSDQTWVGDQQQPGEQHSSQHQLPHQSYHTSGAVHTNPYGRPWQPDQLPTQDMPAWQKRTQKPPSWMTGNQPPRSQSSFDSEEDESTEP